MARIREGFDKDSGRNLGRETNGATKILQYLGPKQKIGFDQLYAHNPTLAGTRYSNTDDPNNYLNMDYEMHLGPKLNTFSSKAHNYIRQQKYSYYRTNANKSAHKS